MSYRSKSPRAKAIEEKRGLIFQKRVIAGLKDKGAIESEHGVGYSLELETPAGLVLLHPRDTWVAGLFPDVEKARAFFGVSKYDLDNAHNFNPIAGKWTHCFGKHKSQKDAANKAKRYLRIVQHLLDRAVAEPRPVDLKYQDDLVLEFNTNEVSEPDPILIGNFVGLVAPMVTSQYWLFRVAISDKQAVVGFPKFGTIGIGFQHEPESWNTNLPYCSETQEIYNHIKCNQGEEIPKDKVLSAISMIQRSAAQLKRGYN